MLHVVILAGGVGSRLWPESTPQRPKPFLKLVENSTVSLLAATVTRAKSVVAPENVWIVTGSQWKTATLAELDGFPADNLLCEPVGKNTAPAIARAAIHIAQQDSDATLLVLPADHHIDTVTMFHKSVHTAIAAVQQEPEKMVLFGVPPTFPATCYGYIETKAESVVEPHIAAKQARQVLRFHEKPDRTTAENYLAAGNFYWNSGIFLWRAATFLHLLQRYEPDMVSTLRLCIEEKNLRNVSVDVAVLEKVPESLLVVPADFVWNDLGNWEMVVRHTATSADMAGNISSGGVQLQTVDSSDNFIRSTVPNRTIALFGVHNLLVVEHGDVLMIVDKNAEPTVRDSTP